MSNYQANIITKNPATPTGPVQNGSAPGMWRMDEVAYWVKQGVWPTQGIVPSDPYFPYVSMLLSTTSLGNANNNLFVDSSGAFNPISRNGNTTQGSATPYSTNWSNYFDGTGDYLSVADNAALQFGTGNFTVECWVNSTVTTSTLYNTVVGKWGSGFNTTGDWALRTRFSSNQVTFTLRYSSGWYDIQSGVSINDGAWHHIAAVRDSATTIKVYVDGTLRVTQNISASDIVGSSAAVGVSGTAFLGGQESAFTGYISNARIVKGTAVYTSNFTPSTTALTAIANTSLLTCQSNRFRDASSNNFTITRNGDTRVTDFSPFAPAYPGITYNQSDITNWSGYFDGSGDYLAVPSTSALPTANQAYTIEAWIYPTTINTNNGVIGWGTYGTTNAVNAIKITSTQIFNYWWANDLAGNFTFTAGQWYHIVAQFDGTTRSLYVNGTRLATDTPTGHNVPSPVTNATIGVTNSTEYFTGSISNVRVITGQAIYSGASFTVPTSPLTAISGTSLLTLQNAAFTDNSTNNFVITQNGNVTVTGNSPFNTVGYWSNYFDGTGDWLASSSTLTIGTGDFTFEAWAYLTGTGGGYPQILSSGTSALPQFGFTGTSNFYTANASNQYTYATTTIPLNSWIHVAACRSGSTLRLFINGQQITSSTDTGSYTLPGFNIGGYNGGTANGAFQGYLSNIRVVNSALYTSNFTPSTTPLTAISGTSLLTCQNGRFIDNSTNNFTITRNGDTSVQSFDPFYTATIASNGGSMYFDNTGDYLAIPASPSLAFGTGNFTLEAWVYGAGAWSTDPIFESRSSGSSSTGYAFLVNSSGYLNVYTAGGFVGNSSTTLNVGSWNHVALVRSGTGTNQTTYYINGVASGTITLAGNFTDANTNETKIGGSTSAGENWNGYISNARISRFAVYTGNFTPPTTPLTPSANTTLLVNGMNAGLFDATAINDMETVGNAQVTTAVSKFGGSSVYFDGNGDYLHFPYPVEFFTPTSWTLEGWVYINSLASAVGIFGYSDLLITRITSTAIRIEYRNNPSSPVWMINESSYTFNTGTWYHIAFVLDNGSFRTYVNGTAVGSASTGVGAGAKGGTGPQKLIIGATDQFSFDSVDTFLNGYMDDVRITTGVARYTTNFTPPTQAFPTY